MRLCFEVVGNIQVQGKEGFIGRVVLENKGFHSPTSNSSFCLLRHAEVQAAALRLDYLYTVDTRREFPMQQGRSELWLEIGRAHV